MLTAAEPCCLELENGAVGQLGRSGAGHETGNVVLCLWVMFFVSQIRPLCCMGEFSHRNPRNPSCKAAQGPLHRKVETLRLALDIDPAVPCLAGGVSGSCGGAVNRHDVPDGGIHLHSETMLAESGIETVPRRETISEEKPDSNHVVHAFRPVFSSCSVRDCASRSCHESSKISAF